MSKVLFEIKGDYLLIDKDYFTDNYEVDKLNKMLRIYKEDEDLYIYINVNQFRLCNFINNQYLKMRIKEVKDKWI